MNKDNDRNIKHIYEQLREEEVKKAPSFQKILEGRKPEASPSVPWYRFFMRPAVVMLILAVIAVSVIFNSLQNPDAIEISAEFESWESPTDFLLTFNDDPSMAEIPEFETSVWEIQEEELLEN